MSGTVSAKQGQLLRENFIMAVIWAIFLAPFLAIIIFLLSWLLHFLQITGVNLASIDRFIFFPSSFIFAGLWGVFMSNPLYSGFYRDLSFAGMLNVAFMFFLLTAIRFF